MEKFHIQFKPNRTDAITFDQLFDEISGDWRYKAEALQTRRWRALRRQIRDELS